MYSLSSVASLVCGMNVAEYKHQPFGEDLAQFGEIVLHNLIESMRVQDRQAARRHDHGAGAAANPATTHSRVRARSYWASAPNT